MLNQMLIRSKVSHRESKFAFRAPPLRSTHVGATHVGATYLFGLLLLGLQLGNSSVVGAATVGAATVGAAIPTAVSATSGATLNSSNFGAAAACPFCSAINMTFWEQIKSHDAVVIAKLISLPPPVADIDAELPKAEFEVVRVLRGAEHIEPEAIFRVLLVGEYPLGQEFVVMGVNPPGFVWSTPLKATPRVVEYVESLGKLPEKGPERLFYFQKYFEDEESILAFDAYDEFARAPYEDVLALKDRMDRNQLVAWILDPETSVNRRRLYFTMLGVCGGSDDIEMLERLIRSSDRKDQAGLDALVSCYLKLKGPDGLALIEEEFLKNDEADYVDTLATISALRFHGSEEKIIPRDRLVAAVRTLLDRPKMADMIIPDLARWEDWSVMEKLVELFKTSTEETIWVRVPVIQYLQVCPKPEAKKYIEELRKIDPDAVARAALFNEIDLESESDEDEKESDSKEAGGKKPADKPDGDKGEGKDGGKDGGEEDLSASLTEDTLEPVATQTLRPLPATPIQEVSSNQDSATDSVGRSVLPQKRLRVPFGSNDPADSAELPVPSQLEPESTGGAATPTLNADSPNLPEPPPEGNVEKGKQPLVAPAAVPSLPIAVDPSAETLTSLAPVAPAIPVDIGMVDLPGATDLPIAAATGTAPMKIQAWRTIALPVVCSCLLFALLWSVINGWFERLIF